MAIDLLKSAKSDDEGTQVQVKETTLVEVQVKPERPDNWRTMLVVCALIGAAIVAAAFILTGWRWGTFCLFLSAWEGWTLVNKYQDDTISEAIWILAKRPITVLLFGLFFGIGAGTGYLGDTATVLRAFAIGLLYGHFFFTPVTSETVSTKIARTE